MGSTNIDDRQYLIGAVPLRLNEEQKIAQVPIMSLTSEGVRSQGYMGTIA